MSTPRIKIERVRSYGAGWRCMGEHPSEMIRAAKERGAPMTTATWRHGWTIAAAADAGRAHLAEHHAPTVGTYCRAHGCQRVECGCALGDQNGAVVAPRGHTERSTGSFGDDFPCCADLTPDLLRAHNTSREDV